MPAPRQFRRDEALREAMHVFWTHGYEATGVRDLCEAMGLGPSSLYREFGSKHALLIDALDLYADEVLSRHTAMLHDPRADLETIGRYLRETALGLASGDWTRACLMINTAMELAPADDAVVRRFTAYLRGMERGFRVIVERAQATGDLEPKADPDALAQYLAAVAQSLVIVGKGTKDRDRLLRIVDVGLQVLGGGPRG